VQVKQSKVMQICIVHRRIHDSNELPLPVCRHWSPQARSSARHQWTLQDDRYWQVNACMHSNLPLSSCEIARDPQSGELTLLFVVWTLIVQI